MLAARTATDIHTAPKQYLVCTGCKWKFHSRACHGAMMCGITSSGVGEHPFQMGQFKLNLALVSVSNSLLLRQPLVYTQRVAQTVGPTCTNRTSHGRLVTHRDRCSPIQRSTTTPWRGWQPSLICLQHTLHCLPLRALKIMAYIDNNIVH